MKKNILLFLSFMLLIVLTTNNSYTTLVSATEDINQKEIDKQLIANKLFDEMNTMLALKAQSSILENSTNKSRAMSGSSLRLSTKQMNKRITEIDGKLAQIGIHKIDPDNLQDQKILSELQTAGSKMISETKGGSIYDHAPDLSALSRCYSIYMTDGVLRYDGKKYNFRVIRLIDDKGSNGLTANKVVRALSDKEYKGNRLRSILAFNFKFTVDKITSALIPQEYKNYETFCEWVMGNMFTFLSNSSNISVIVNTKDPIYLITNVSVTSMAYYYIYVNNEWTLAAVNGRASIARMQSFSGNVNGVPKAEAVSETAVLQTNKTYYDLYANYLQFSYIKDYICVDSLGSIDITVPYGGGDDDYRVYKFTPRFYELPGYITY